MIIPAAPSQNIDGKIVTKIEKNLDDFFKETHNNSISIDGDVNYYIIEESLGTIESLRSASLISAKEYNDLIQMGEDTDIELYATTSYAVMDNVVVRSTTSTRKRFRFRKGYRETCSKRDDSVL